MTPDEVAAIGARMGFQIAAPRFSRQECEQQLYAHNQRTRFTTGVYCEDCGLWMTNDEADRADAVSAAKRTKP